MKVLLVTDKHNSAIDRLAQIMPKAAPWHLYKIVDVHPKRPSPEQLKTFEEAYAWCDVVDFRYWKTAEVIRSLYAITKPFMLVHHNPYDIEKKNWNDYKINVVANGEQLAKFKNQAVKIPYPVDLEFWEYDPAGLGHRTYDVIMVANRIEGKKGILPVVRAIAQLGKKMLLVGNVSDDGYYLECRNAGLGHLDFQENISNEALRDAYHASSLLICNSIDNYESGPLPVLEAMACGTPVLTTRVGHIPDLANGRNMILRKGTSEDTEELKSYIVEAFADLPALAVLAHEARQSLRYRHISLYGWMFSKQYHKLASENQLISVIIPTARKPEEWMGTMAHVLAQNVQDLEVILADDSEYPEKNAAAVEEIRKTTSRTIKYFCTTLFDAAGNKTYGLARARNRGIIEAEGDWIAFVDDRILLEQGALEALYGRRKDNCWLWGVKDNSPKAFVENFSFIRRSSIIKIGMFNEQITQYGGMSQEIRRRSELNQIGFEMVEAAKAIRGAKSGNKWAKQIDIAKSKMQCYKLYGEK